MERRIDGLESRLAEIVAELESLKARVERLEAPTEARPEGTPAVGGAASEWEAATEGLPPVTSVVALTGRAFVVFAGAFLLRTAADAGVVPIGIGVAAGLLYAAAILVLAGRDAATGKVWSCCFHGASTLIIGLPLIYEGVVRFGVLDAVSGAAILVALALLELGLAWRRGVQALVWLATAGTCGLGLVLLLKTGSVVTFGSALLVIGLATVLIGYRCAWFGPRWLAAAAVDVVFLQMVLLATRAGGPPPPYDGLAIRSAQWLALALPVGYLALFAFHNLARQRRVTPFEVTQTVAALVLGLGGAMRIGAQIGQRHGVLGLATLGVAIGCYAVAFAFAERRLGMGRNFHFYSFLALALTMAGGAVLLHGAALSFMWAVLAGVAAFLGGQFDRVTLRTHAAAYAASATLQSGLAAAALDAFVAGAGTPWRPFGGREFLALGALIVCSVVLVFTARRRDYRGPARLPRLAIAILAVAGVGGACVSGIVTAVGRTGDGATVALARSVVLAAAAVVLAAAGRASIVRELSWLVYPVLVVGGIKLLAEDLTAGTPVALFGAFAAYGMALIVAPRLVRSGPTDLPTAKN